MRTLIQGVCTGQMSILTLGHCFLLPSLFLSSLRLLWSLSLCHCLLASLSLGLSDSCSVSFVSIFLHLYRHILVSSSVPLKHPGVPLIQKGSLQSLTPTLCPRSVPCTSPPMWMRTTFRQCPTSAWWWAWSSMSRC